MIFDELVASLRQIDGQRDKGKHPPNFHLRSNPFLHFHNGPDRTYADVRFGEDFEPVTASTPGSAAPPGRWPRSDGIAESPVLERLR
jgi:hypothetical protein